MQAAPLLSVVIPTVDEQAGLGALLSDLARLTAAHEVIVVDGGSSDLTVDVAAGAGARVLQSPRGRGVQLAAGASASRAPLLLFVHADVRLDDEARRVIDDAAVARPRCAMAFRLRIDGAGASYRLIEWGANLRSRYFGLPYGDQGLLVRREDYLRAGGYPPVPLMEDVALIRALRPIAPLRLLNAAITVSDRRWRAEGAARRTLRNWVLLTRYLAGARPDRLVRDYRPQGPRHG